MNADESSRARKVHWNELVALTDLWAQCLYLYGARHVRGETMNACAPWFFRLVRRAFVHLVFLSTSRLTNPPQQSGYRDFTIHVRTDDPQLDQHRKLRIDLTDASYQQEAYVSAVRTHRRKTIAHLDHATALDDEDGLLLRVPRSQLGEAVLAFAAIYNQHSIGTISSFNHFDLKPRGGSDAILAALEQSRKWKAYVARLKSREGRDRPQ